MNSELLRAPTAILIASALFGLISCAGPVEEPKSEPAEIGSDLPLKIYDSVRSTGKLKDEDRRILIAFASDAEGKFTNRHQAILTLQAAAECKAFPIADLLALIERNAILAEGVETTLYAREYWNALKLPMNPGSNLDAKADALMNEKLEDRTITPSEVDLLRELFASNGTRDKGLASEVLLRKRKLNSRDYELSLAYAKGQIASMKGAELEYWQFVDRVVRARK